LINVDAILPSSRSEGSLAILIKKDLPMYRFALALAAMAMLAAPVTAAGTRCRDAHGKFIKCPTPKKTVRCKSANGKFAKCGTAGAKPV
jgi:hypothetical protein